MNNKGFAITSILYTLFILFMLTLFAVLSGLNTRDKLMSKSVEKYESEHNYSYNYYSGDYSSYGNVAKSDGLYIFTNSTGYSCSAYLKKGTDFSNITFIRKSVDDSCDKYNNDFSLSGIYYKKDW